jgi:hypothetical protein
MYKGREINSDLVISYFANGAYTQHKIASESQQKLLHIPNTIAAFTKQYCVKIQFQGFRLKCIKFI